MNDIALAAGARGAAFAAASLLLLVAGFVLVGSLPALGNIGALRMATDGAWLPTHDASGSFSLAPAVVGSLAVTVGAVLIAAPVGVLAAVCAGCLAPRGVRRGFALLIGVMAGLPSVVLGLWGLTVLAPIVASVRPPGPSVLAASIVLALMIVPTIAIATGAALGAAPDSTLNAARGCGLSGLATFRLALWPIAKAGAVVGVLLGAMRAVGETMVVVMVSGNVPGFPTSVFDPVRTLTANIALEMGYAMGDHRSALFASGLLLTGVVLVLVLVSRRIGGAAHA